MTINTIIFVNDQIEIDTFDKKMCVCIVYVFSEKESGDRAETASQFFVVAKF